MSPNVATAIITLMLISMSRGGPLRIVLHLPSTFCHELAHWLVAVLTGAKPGLPSLWPKRVADGWQLGHVAFEAHWLSAGLIALAPLWLLLPLAAWLLLIRGPASVPEELAYGALSAIVFKGAWPSVSDWVIAAQSPFGAALSFFIIWQTGTLLRQTLNF
jgi:hypothetical protein